MSDRYLDYFVHGWGLYMRFNKAANAEAREEYRNAIAENPKFCRAYADLAYSIFHAWLFNWDQSVNLQDAMNELAKAPSNCSDDYYYLWVKGALHLYQRDFPTADALYKQSWALASNVAIPSDLDSLQVDRAEMLLLTGNEKQAIADINEVLEKKKVHEKWFYWVLSWAYYADEQWQNAIDAIRKNIGHPRNAMRLNIVASLVALDRTSEAVEEAKHYLSEEKSQSIAYPSLSDFLNVQSRIPFQNTDKSTQWLNQLRVAFEQVLPPP